MLVRGDLRKIRPEGVGLRWMTMGCRLRYCPAMPEPIVIHPADTAEAEIVLAVMRRGFAEYRGVLKPESSVFAETATVVADRLAAGGGFLALHGATPIG